MAVKMSYFKRCPDCGGAYPEHKMVVVHEDGKTFDVCIDCYEDIHFERTEIWKLCMKNPK